MNRLQEALIRVDTELRQLDIRWALVGGLAVSTRSEPRSTRDIDLVVSLDTDLEAERLVLSLRNHGYDIFGSDGVLEQTNAERLATVRLESPHQVVVDLMFASSGIEDQIVGAAELVEVLPNLLVPVASRGHLIAMKVLADRDQDRIDLRNLLAHATAQDLLDAREALDLIDRRGFSRAKDLQSILSAHLHNLPSGPQSN